MGTNSENLNSDTLGAAGKSLGKSAVAWAASTLSFTFLRASEGATEKSNLTRMVLNPWLDVLVTLSTPDSPLTSFSMGRVTNRSMSNGALPG